MRGRVVSTSERDASVNEKALDPPNSLPKPAGFGRYPSPNAVEGTAMKNWEQDVALYLLAGFVALGLVLIGDDRAGHLVAAVKALLLGHA